VGTVIAGITKVAKIPMENYAILVLSGAELTYIPPKLIKDAADKCRKLGGEITIVHGETIAETVTPKTNIYTVEAGVNILAHPGHLPEEEAGIATENSAKIEITSRRGHGVTNNEVAEVVLKKAKLVLNTDTHSPENLLSKEFIVQVLSDANLPSNCYDIMQKNSIEIIKSKRI
jgi:histidinol phosphatase-like PHP family hydrolase